MDFVIAAEQLREHIIALRREFHQHPELSFEEERTSSRVCEELEALGIPYEKLEKHCVVGTITGGLAGAGSRVLAIRADMDALPVTEQADVPFKSRREGVMHACGHDGHTAMLLGAAALLKQAQPQLAGTVKLCFQSAEEVGGGGQIVVDYLKRRGGVNRAIAAHVWSEMPTGTIAVDAGARMAGTTRFTLTMHGQGGHGSRPDLCVDPIKPLCQAILNISAIPTNFVSTLEPCVVHVGHVEAGKVGNVFPQTATAHGGIRAFSEATMDRVRRLVPHMAEAAAEAYGATAEVTYLSTAPMVHNEEAAVRLAHRVVNETGLFRLQPFERICASEDFGHYLNAFGGFMCFIGIRNEEKGMTYTQHHPKFQVDEDVLHKGAAFFAAYAKKYFDEAQAGTE